MQLFIPNKIKVGYQNRGGTYNGKLAYVIYYDQNGKLRKEASWKSWRDEKIDPNNYVNEPTEGFVLNKGVGGQRESYGWNARNEYIRVYDPRGFEFEISVSNLLFILQECDCTRGKGLEGKFVYAWDGTELVLLPSTSEDFKKSEKFTQLQGQKVASKELIPGASYITKKQDVLTFVGRFNYYKICSETVYNSRIHKMQFPKNISDFAKKYVFWDNKNFLYFNDLKHIAALNSDEVIDNLAALIKKYAMSPVGSKPVEFLVKYESYSGYGHDFFYVANNDGSFLRCRKYGYGYNRGGNSTNTYIDYKYYFKNNILFQETVNNYDTYNLDKNNQNRLYVKLESGREYNLSELKTS